MKKYREILLLLFVFALLLYGADQKPSEQQEIEAFFASEATRYAGVTAAFQTNIFDTEIISPAMRLVPVTLEEKAAVVYTFLQGPRAYGESLPWSGEWCEKIVRGRSFGGFGCGLCCMANIYSTLTEYECSPWDMYEYATTASYYYPSRESGAIGWDDMKRTLRAAGFECGIYYKPKTYEEFQEQMKETQSAIVLVSSADDDTFWENTSGHYVNIWLYQEDTDMVFLAEPGDPENNRTWIPLRYVYDALKTVSRFQYLAVTSYTEEKNLWKWDGIDDVWNGRFLGFHSNRI